IACGACSGFHGLVCSGTTSKQIAKETDCREVGYGAMLLEGFVAMIALATVMILANGEAKGSPGAIYGAGIGKFLTLILGKENLVFAITFGAMAFSTFVFDTLDVATRLGRYILQELIGSQSRVIAVLATALTVGVPALFLFVAKEGGWSSFWLLFGTSNQLLAALTLLGVTVWLKRSGRTYWFTLWPMAFVMVITVWSLLIQILAGYRSFASTGTIEISLINAGVSALLLALAALISTEAIRVMKRGPALAF
ncbi:MAG TPA: carbon starvation CstA 5TM domain-containing protein, partial [bacterium]|nr:carbon starvation CstA 5TM domain-containing protein [bacterium]